MRLLYIYLLSLLLPLGAFTQTVSLKGKITDPDGRPVSFASVYEKNTSNGTSANSEGEYQLKLAAGEREIIYKAIGYSQVNSVLDLRSDQINNVILSPAIYELNKVIVTAGAEDPANEVIRNAIRKRKSYLFELDQYAVDVYIKGMQKLLAAPKKFLGRDIEKMGREIGLDTNRQGILYLSESESRLGFMQPDRFREVMISSKVSGSNRAFSFNRASDVKINFYQNLLDMEGLSNRPFISPISDNAFLYYRYQLIGTSIENGEMINKIRVLPRRNADPVFRGIIYILEDSWRLNGADLFITKDANINFVDTLNIKQEFIPVGQGVWMPSSIQYDFTGGILGFRFGGYFIALYKNYDLSPDLNKRDFVEVLNITSGVNKKDTAYWQQARPIPLTAEEESDYNKKEILAAKRETKPYLDSLDKANNKFRPVQFLIGSGYTHRNRFKKENFHFSSLINSVFYNTVEGFGMNYQVSYSRQIDSLTNKFLNISGKARYGSASEKFYASLSGTIPVREVNFSYHLGADVIDLNDQGSISQLGNSINSLFYERNFLKLYEKKFVSAAVSRRLAGFIVNFETEWASRKALRNTSAYTVRDLAEWQFTSNNPLLPLVTLPMFPENQSMKIKLRATYDFNNKYVTYPSGKYYQPSKYPRIGINFLKGIKDILGSDVDYDLLSLDITKSNIKLGMYGQSSFWIGGGQFLNARNVYFPDFKHFVGNRSLSYIPKINNYLFLDFYNFSTADKYLEGHVEHNFSGFLINKVPLLRKLKLKEIAGLNYLGTPALSQYTEVYFGLQYLNLRGMYGMSYIKGKRLDEGFKIAYGF